VIVLDTASAVIAHLDRERSNGRTVGMIGTTGSLHEGHLSLVRAAKAQNDVAVMFWAGALSLEWAPGSSPSYTPDMQRDLDLAAGEGLDVCFVLNRADLYVEPSATSIVLPAFDAGGELEDPAHLRTVATMVATFCNITGPCRTYFGEKDWQQLVMLQKMARDLYLRAEVVGCPVVREADGLARSSRNQKLSAQSRAQAPALFQGLQAAAAAVADGERVVEKVVAIFTDVVAPVADIDYVKVVEPHTLAPLERLDGPARVIVSASFGGVRLVDNVGVTPPS
jgi:pantoate--beta-alanine ligase